MWWTGRPKQPAEYAVEGSELLIYDVEKKFLWSHDFKKPLTKRCYNSDDFHNIIINDIDHDGETDVLIGTYEGECPDLSDVYGDSTMRDRRYGKFVLGER